MVTVFLKQNTRIDRISIDDSSEIDEILRTIKHNAPLILESEKDIIIIPSDNISHVAIQKSNY